MRYRAALRPDEAGEPGFEPGLADPESAVLPLYYSPLESGRNRTRTYDLYDVNVAL